MSELRDQLSRIEVLPVLTIDSVDDALNLCYALQAGGIHAVEITLRTPVAWDAIAAVQDTFPAFTVAAGTVKTTRDLEKLAKLKVEFAVSPGFAPVLSDCAADNELVFLPGIATPSELMAGIEKGHNCFKLFPAEAVGGIALLRSLASPFPDVRFCPTGGINPRNYSDYLALPNVVCVGGSWMAVPELIRNKQWDRISQLSRECLIDRGDRRLTPRADP